MLLKISQILQENISKVADLICCNFIKKRLKHRCFPVRFAKLLRTLFFTEHLQWLLSAFIKSTYALWIKLICRDSGTSIFLRILPNFKKHYWPPPVAASFCHKIQNITRQLHAMSSLFDSKYSQWGNRFLPITEAYFEPSRVSTMKLFCKNSWRLKVINYFCKKPDRRFWLGYKYLLAKVHRISTKRSTKSFFL